MAETMPDVDICTSILEAEEALRRALLTGADTRAFHEQLAGLRATQARAVAEEVEAHAQARAKAAAAHKTRIAEIAERHIADVNTRLSSRMNGFAIPTASR